MVIRRAKIFEHDKLILNSHNKVKTTWGIVNKESGKNEKRSEIQAVKVEGRQKSPINKLLLKLVMSIRVLYVTV